MSQPWNKLCLYLVTPILYYMLEIGHVTLVAITNYDYLGTLLSQVTHLKVGHMIYSDHFKTVALYL